MEDFYSNRLLEHARLERFNLNFGII